MEPVSFPKLKPKHTSKEWALTGAKDRPTNLIKSLYLDPEALEEQGYTLLEVLKDA